MMLTSTAYCVLIGMVGMVCVDNFERLYTTLNQLMVEGDLLEVSMPEKLMLRSVLRTCRPADYEQIVFGFPVSASFNPRCVLFICVEQ